MDSTYKCTLAVALLCAFRASTAWGDEIDRIATKALAAGPIAGISIAVLRGSTFDVLKGYGYADVAQRTPATADTVYDTASISKLFTAIAVMRLVETGQLQLDDTLARVLPEFPNAAQANRITVRHLLAHTSGLADYEAAHTGQWQIDGAHVSTPFVLGYLRDRELEFAPGSEWSYSNSGYYLLALIVERISGQRFGQYLRDRIAGPLGLTRTQLCDDVPPPERAVTGYGVVDGKLVPGGVFTIRNIKGDGGVCSTVGDLARLPAALKRGKLLDSDSLAQMLRPTQLPSGATVDYGFGVRRGALEGRALWGHTGGLGTYWSVLAHYPDDITIVVLANTDEAAEDALTIEGEVARSVFGLGEPALQNVPLATRSGQGFSGTYGLGAEAIVIAVDGGRLTFARQGSGRPARVLLQQADESFGWTAYPMNRVIFHVVGDRVLGMSEYYNGIFANYAPRLADRSQ